MATPNEFVSRLPGRSLGQGKMLSTRRGMLTVAGLAGLAALGLLLIFMSNFRDSVRGGAAPTPVLVAKELIDKGTSGEVIAEASLVEVSQVREDEAVTGVFTDVSAIDGLTATEAIYPGQQLAVSSFTTGADPVIGKLDGTDRAIALPFDAARGNIGQISAGSRVDVLGGFNAEIAGGRARPVLDVLARNILVLRAPATAEDSEDQQVVLRVTDAEASRIAFASDTGDVWLTARPPTRAENSKVRPVQLENLIGSRPVGGR